MTVVVASAEKDRDVVSALFKAQLKDALFVQEFLVRVFAGEIRCLGRDDGRNKHERERKS